MKLKLSDLRRATEAIFDHLEREGRVEMEIPEDFYWSIPDQELYAAYARPSGLTLGQLSDDLREVQEIAAGRKPPIAYALVWLSSLFRLLGARIVS